jgi:hypothetical protein
VWQPDNAPSHRKASREELNSEGKGLLWPPYNPDRSPIEHMWAMFKHQPRGIRFNDEEDLFDGISRAWDSIEMTTINRLVNSFRARCRVCVELNGGCLNRHWRRVSKVAEQLALGTAH